MLLYILRYQHRRKGSRLNFHTYLLDKLQDACWDLEVLGREQPVPKLTQTDRDLLFKSRIKN
jgi:hypothetical protein